MTSKAYPRLFDLMNTYFHQDYDLYHNDNMSVLDEYVADNSAKEQDDILSELEDLLSSPTEGLLGRFEAATAPGNLLIGEDDESARRWLVQARDRLAAAGPAPSPPKPERGTVAGVFGRVLNLWLRGR